MPRPVKAKPGEPKPVERRAYDATSRQAQSANTRQRIVDAARSLMLERGYRVTPHLTYGEPTEEIVELAKALPADLIVVGHKREASLAQRWWKGSVGASLIEVAPCSVLIAIEH